MILRDVFGDIQAVAATSTAAAAADRRIHTRTRGAGGVATVGKFAKFCGTCLCIFLRVIYLT